MDVEVRIYQVLPAEGGTSAKTGNAWKRQSFVAETLDRYPRKICFTVTGEDKIERLGIDKLKTGDKKIISFQIDSREYQGKWYNEVSAWYVRDCDEAIKDDPSSAI